MARPKIDPTKKKVKQNVVLDPDLLDRVITYCQKEERSISWVAGKAIAEWMEKHERAGD